MKGRPAMSEKIRAPSVEDTIPISRPPVLPLRQPFDRAKRRRERRERRREVTKGKERTLLEGEIGAEKQKKTPAAP
jgi:hypothetical protein